MAIVHEIIGKGIDQIMTAHNQILFVLMSLHDVINVVL